MAGLHTYAVIGICEPEAFLKVKAVWDSIFTFVDVLFFADDHLTKPSGNFSKYLCYIKLICFYVKLIQEKVICKLHGLECLFHVVYYLPIATNFFLPVL